MFEDDVDNALSQVSIAVLPQPDDDDDIASDDGFASDTSGGSSLPEVSELLARTSQSMRTSSATTNSEAQQQPPAAAADEAQTEASAASSPSPKLEYADQPLPQTPAGPKPRRSTRNLKLKENGSPAESSASVDSGKMAVSAPVVMEKSAGSSRTAASKKKRALENGEGSSELPQVPATQPASAQSRCLPRRDELWSGSAVHML
ncbi:hypothetical protein OH76DRAFT_194745 [Lentinus brumalis]|uniref:Uncharacterized protein n=1 Tax=Lentinus brumalis TaxID=2498619 RepID=A0A371DHY8_9APHY|nr:hypothetical protein OH76DRAFT_194745 [Polyporus brumalis]